MQLMRGRVVGALGALAGVALAAACGGGQSPPSPAADPGRSVSPTASASAASGSPTDSPVVCPNPMGGQCVGELEAHTRYRTETFTPRIGYATPAGWSNLEDLRGNFLLLPPGRSIDGVDTGTDDYLGIYSGASVAAADCAPEPMPGVGLEPDAIAAALVERPGLDVSAPRKVTVGGLEGVAVTIEVEPGTTAGCEVEGGLRIIPLFIGVGPASVEHAQVPGLQTHLYVLDNGRSDVVIEVSDVASDKRRFDHDLVVEKLRFSPA